jgi:ribosomal protein S18 acetylase RimI-like enzyme
MDPIRCEVLKRNDVRQLVHLVARTLCADEPMGVAAGLLAPDVERFLQASSEQLLSDGLTMVAVDTATGKLAGALISDDLASPLSAEQENLSPKFLPVFALLGALDENYRKGATLSYGQYLHLFMLTIDKRFRGRGIGQMLVGAAVENGAEMGYRYAVVEATGVISQHLFRKAGFVERCRTSYAEFRYEGAAPFASIQGHEAAILMDKPLEG